MVGAHAAPPTLAQKGDEMRLVLIGLAVWFCAEMLLLAGLFLLAALEERVHSSNLVVEPESPRGHRPDRGIPTAA
jgi:hypothetical protein